jgi:quercetin dioxygenase-like cupin family protein
MDRDEFIEMLAREGFTQTELVEREPDGFVDEHAHPFEAKALILEGELTIQGSGKEKRYKTGDVFHLKPNEPHWERYGPKGVCYLVGRK